MNLLRLWRTVKYLSAEQWLYRLVCRGDRVWMTLFPGVAHDRIERTSTSLPVPKLNSPDLLKAAEAVLRLQSTVYCDDFTDVRSGRFLLLNQKYDFGDVDGIRWREEFKEERNNPLRRMTLAYMGYVVPLLAEGRQSDLKLVSQILAELEKQNHWSIPGVFRDVWNAYTVSHRVINLLAGLALFLRSGGTLEIRSHDVIMTHIRFCVAFVLENLERDLQYNHLLKNYVSLAVYASAVGHLPKSLSDLPSAIDRSIEQNVLPDGGHSERCPMYHVLCMNDLDVLSSSGVLGDEFVAKLTSTKSLMKDALAVVTHPDGDIALFNDSWIGEAPRAAGFLQNVDMTEFARSPSTGYVRMGRESDVVIFDCGPCGPDDNPGHAHADFLSIELSINGHRFFVDPGVPTYSEGKLRNLSRSASCHNGPSIKGEEPIEFWKSFRVGRRGKAVELDSSCFADLAPLCSAGSHDGYAHLRSEVRRFLFLWPEESLLVIDVVVCEEPKDCFSRFLIPTSWRKTGTGMQFCQEDTQVDVKALIGQMSPAVESSHWPRFGLEMAAHSFSINPVRQNDRHVSAMWVGWSDSAVMPDDSQLSRFIKVVS